MAVFLPENFDQEDLGLDDLFSDLRVEGIEHLGQVRTAILEPNGQLSVFQFDAEVIRPGLPILPNELKKHSEHIDQSGDYACCSCGNVQMFNAPADRVSCQQCNKTGWVKAIK